MLKPYKIWLWKDFCFCFCRIHSTKCCFRASKTVWAEIYIKWQSFRGKLYAIWRNCVLCQFVWRKRYVADISIQKTKRHLAKAWVGFFCRYRNEADWHNCITRWEDNFVQFARCHQQSFWGIRSLQNWNGLVKTIRLSDAINSKEGNYFASISSKKNIYFTRSVRKGDIYVSRFVNNIYKQAVPLDSSINSELIQSNPYISQYL